MHVVGARFGQGTRILTYLDLHMVWETMPTAPFPLCRYAINSRFDTSWSNKVVDRCQE